MESDQSQAQSVNATSGGILLAPTKQHQMRSTKRDVVQLHTQISSFQGSCYTACFLKSMKIYSIVLYHMNIMI